jgi:lipoate-protein ligase A
MNKIIVSRMNDPYFNLAFENWLLERVEINQRFLFIYINSPCVVIGRFQNPWIEANLDALFKSNIQLIRRQSGGGTVFHDIENINFSIISDKKIHNPKFNHQVIVNALNDISVDAYATKRGDVRLNDGTDRKISGSAFKHKKDQAFHHGTMLINSDIDKLNFFIKSNKQDLETKSIASIRSKVANIKEVNNTVTNQVFIDSLIKQFGEVCDTVTIEYIDDANSIRLKLEPYISFLKSKEWKFYETPKFFVEEDIIEDLRVELTIKKAKIQKVQILSNTYNPILLSEIEKQIQGSILDIGSVCTELDKILNFDEHLILKIKKWFIKYFNLDQLASL